MDYLFQDGGKPKKVTKTKTKPKPKPKPKKTKTTSGSRKGGNFLGSVGELVAPTGWESFATTAGLFAIDRADAALRRGKESKKSVKKMSGGNHLNLNSTPFTGDMQGLLRRKDGSIKPNNSIFLKQLENDIENEIRECELEWDNIRHFYIDLKVNLKHRRCPKTKRMILDELTDKYYDEEYYNKKIELTTMQRHKNNYNLYKSKNLFQKNTEKIEFADKLVKWYISKLDKLISRRNELLKKINQNNTILQGFLNRFTNKSNNETIQMKLQRELKLLEEHKKDYQERGLEIRPSYSNREEEYYTYRKECQGINNKPIPGTEGSVNSLNNTDKKFKNGIKEIYGNKNKPKYKYLSEIIIDLSGRTKESVINELVNDYKRRNPDNKLNRSNTYLIENYRERINGLISKRNELLNTVNIIQKKETNNSKRFLNKFSNNGDTIQEKLEYEIKTLENHLKYFNDYLKKNG